MSAVRRNVGIVLKRYHQHQLLTTPTRYRYYSPTKDTIAWKFWRNTLVGFGQYKNLYKLLLP